MGLEGGGLRLHAPGTGDRARQPPPRRPDPQDRGEGHDGGGPPQHAGGVFDHGDGAFRRRLLRGGHLHRPGLRPGLDRARHARAHRHLQESLDRARRLFRDRNHGRLRRAADLRSRREDDGRLAALLVDLRRHVAGHRRLRHPRHALAPAGAPRPRRRGARAGGPRRDDRGPAGLDRAPGAGDAAVLRDLRRLHDVPAHKHLRPRLRPAAPDRAGRAQGGRGADAEP